MRLLPFLLSSLLLSPVTAAMAQAAIHRCIGANGNPVFTDGACSDMQATPTRPPASVHAAGNDRNVVLDAPPPILCAANLAQLKQGVVDAFALRDANRLAGLMLWSGEGRSAVVADIRSLSALMQRPLVDFGESASSDPATATGASAGVSPAISVSGAISAISPGVAATEPAPAALPELLLRTASDNGTGIPRETRFDVVRRSGCLWLREP